MGFIQYVPQMFPLVIIFSLLSRCSGKLEIRTTNSAIEALLGHNTAIPCHFSGYRASSLTTSMVSVRWTLGTQKELVYLFDGGRLIQNRSGSHISEDDLVRGDASLHIPSLQFSDEGDYSCNVFITPDKATGEVTVRVSAMPACTVSDSKLEMNPDTERSVTCYVHGFYPESVKIQWLKSSKASSNQFKQDSRTCTSIPVQNQDGTYNGTSVLSVRPMSPDEDGDVYSCVVIHRSLKDDLTLNVTLSVKPIEGHKIPGWILPGIFLTISILAGVISYYCIKVKPNVTEINTTDLIHMKECALTCFISGFKPKNLTIKLCFKKDKGNETEVDSWSSIKPRSEEENTEQGTHLLTRREPTGLALEPLMKSHKIIFSCDCFINITPMFHIHNGALLTLEVHHAALKLPICKQLQLKVKCPPKMDQIEANQEVYKAGDLLQLKCKIHSFYPKSIKVIWHKDHDKIASQDSNAEKDEKGLFSVISSVQYTVGEEDFEKSFRCTVNHQNTSETAVWKLEKQADPPIMDAIQANQVYSAGETLELKCKIHSFYPKTIKVTWYKGEEILSQISEHEDERQAYYVLSCMSYTVQEEDFGEIFTCKVTHPYKNDSVRWRLEKKQEMEEKLSPCGVSAE